MEVEYVTPRGDRATIAVPYQAWRDGAGARLGPHVAKLVEDVRLQSARHASSVPD